MTASELRQSFLDFFQETGHTAVPSASLMPTSPNLLFTNAGMNQFVPYFLGTANAPYNPPRAADTQKCIRAGGKHNDLEDVGYDTYHHTFFEMLGNWSFGDYFKKEAISWAWELLVGRWGFPPERLYATVYRPGDGDPADFDEEAYGYWKAVFESAGLDPEVHIVDGGKKDNFWMMGETGPCGPCSELHIDLTPGGDTKGALVNADDARCIEIWNLVFIQYNAEEDGSFRPLPARHVDTGMGYERACSVIQCTGGFTDFSRLPSNYDTDVFGGLFEAISDLGGKSYGKTLPEMGKREGLPEQEQADVAFRVVADHLRTLSFSIADGILPGNNDRNYVLRRILRRAVRYGRNLGLGTDGKPFLSRLLPVLVSEMGSVFPELVKRQGKIAETLDLEEASFNNTLDRGLALFGRAVVGLGASEVFPAETAFELYDTYGFPVDLTALLCAEKGIRLDEGEVGRHMEKQRERSRAAHQSTTVKALEASTDVVTEFVGFDQDQIEATVLQTIENDGETFVIVDRCPFYAEMGGQIGDTGTLVSGGEETSVMGIAKIGDAFALQVKKLPVKDKVTLKIDVGRRRAIEGHHTVTHLLHWALHEIIGKDIAQQGSLVAPDRLRFDFNSRALSPEEIVRLEEAVVAKVTADESVSWKEVPYKDVQGREDIMQFFGDKYGDTVRVVQIGGNPGALDGYSMELCGGTHVRSTGQVGKFKIKSEGAIAAGVRRIEAVCGDAADAYLLETAAALRDELARFRAKLDQANAGLEEPVSPGATVDSDDLAVMIRQRDALKEAAAEADKRRKKAQAAEAAEAAETALGELITKATEGSGRAAVVHAFEGTPQLLQELLNTFKKKQFDGVAVVAVNDGEKIHLGAYVAKAHQADLQAGKLVQELAPVVGGKGGGKPEVARGAGEDVDKLDELLTRASQMVG